jgi:hypothetical protein
MSQIPIYLKTGPETERPADDVFYWMTGNGLFLCRNHDFFTSDVPARQPPRALAAHAAGCQLRYPKVPVLALETMVGFFSKVYDLHRSESIILLYWDLDRKGYRLVVPEQEASVWEGQWGGRSAMDVRYKVPLPTPRQLLVGDAHCHADMAAYSSTTDRNDELHFDGIHIVVGRVASEPPDIHVEMSIDNHRFPVHFDEIFEGYEQRRQLGPRRWLDQVKVKVERPTWNSARSSTYNYNYPGTYRQSWDTRP